MADPVNPFGDLTKMFEQFKLPGVDVSKLVEGRRKDLEALVAANKSAFESGQAIVQKQTEMLQQALQGVQEHAKSAVAAGLDPAKQGELVRQAFEKTLADMKELAEMARDSQATAMAHITERANEHMAEIKKLIG
ncbi:phasin family protein [Variovorax robiniae]|uniref:Phasin family protein n=1 Tax=Variovorax robiniae TaxID=1836199 RepID=A0ABU8X2Z8_9BURK